MFINVCLSICVHLCECIHICVTICVHLCSCIYLRASMCVSMCVHNVCVSHTQNAITIGVITKERSAKASSLLHCAHKNTRPLTADECG